MKMFWKSQAGQDEWVYDRLPWGVSFLDVGCGQPVEISNTYALEQIGWRGVLIDRNPDLILECQRERASTVIQADAVTFDFSSLARNHFDYLSLDVDESQVTALINILSHGITFKAATIEHDSYRLGPAPRDEMRALLLARGYTLQRRDVTFGGNAYEDWWIDPKAFLGSQVHATEMFTD